MALVVFGPVPPKTAIVTDRQLAVLCTAGSEEAGVQLVERLWARGQVVDIDQLLTVANMDVTPRVFDALADALNAAHLARYRAQNLPPQRESD